MPVDCVPDEGPDLSRFPEKIRGELRRSLHLPDETATPVTTPPCWEYTFALWPVPVSVEQWQALAQQFRVSGEDGWEHYESYPDPTDTGLRIHHFKRQVKA